MPNKKIFLPQIKILIDPRKDAELFWHFLNHKYYKQNRNFILKIFPEIETGKVSTGSKNALNNFVFGYYARREQEIARIADGNEKILKSRGRQALKLLTELMDYRWKKPKLFQAYITILPFSPFQKNLFFYSILGELNNKNPNKKSLLSVAVHEISHIIFLEMVSKIEKRRGIKLHNDAKHYLKEALATALLNMPGFKTILGIKNDPGNPEIQQLYVAGPDRAATTIAEIIFEDIKKWRANKKSFADLLELLVVDAHRNEKQFSRHWRLWNAHGRAIFANKTLLSEYQKPIILIGTRK